MTRAGFLLVVSLGAAVVSLGGCRSRDGEIEYLNHTGREVIVTPRHVHSHTCGHYRHDGRWYHIRGHVHGSHCGHELVNGVWIVKY